MKYLLAFLTCATMMLDAHQNYVDDYDSGPRDIIDLYVDVICDKRSMITCMDIIFEFGGVKYIIDDFHEASSALEVRKIENIYEVPNSKIYIYESSFFNDAINPPVWLK